MESDGLVVEINGILLELNQDVTRLAELVQNANAIGQRIAALQTHQFDLNSSAAILTAGIPDKYREVVQRYKLVIDKLENFRNTV